MKTFLLGLIFFTLGIMTLAVIHIVDQGKFQANTLGYSMTIEEQADLSISFATEFEGYEIYDSGLNHLILTKLVERNSRTKPATFDTVVVWFENGILPAILYQEKVHQLRHIIYDGTWRPYPQEFLPDADTVSTLDTIEYPALLNLR